MGKIGFEKLKCYWILNKEALACLRNKSFANQRKNPNHAYPTDRHKIIEESSVSKRPQRKPQ